MQRTLLCVETDDCASAPNNSHRSSAKVRLLNPSHSILILSYPALEDFPHCIPRPRFGQALVPFDWAGDFEL